MRERQHSPEHSPHTSKYRRCKRNCSAIVNDSDAGEASPTIASFAAALEWFSLWFMEKKNIRRYLYQETTTDPWCESPERKTTKTPMRSQIVLSWYVPNATVWILNPCCSDKNNNLLSTRRTSQSCQWMNVDGWSTNEGQACGKQVFDGEQQHAAQLHESHDNTRTSPMQVWLHDYAADI